jgi:hypothetical protein
MRDFSCLWSFRNIEILFRIYFEEKHQKVVAEFWEWLPGIYDPPPWAELNAMRGATIGAGT